MNLKKIKILFLFISILITVFACSSQAPKAIETPKKIAEPKTEVDLSHVIKNCTCTQQWMPVCGENGKTYSNACFAKCADVKYTIGSCDHLIDE